jgi:hypothetical protein
MAKKVFRALLSVEFPYDAVESPLALAAKIEETLANGKAQVAENIIPASGGHAVVNLSTSIVNARAPKPAEPVALHQPTDPDQTDLEDAVAAAAE